MSTTPAEGVGRDIYGNVEAEGGQLAVARHIIVFTRQYGLQSRRPPRRNVSWGIGEDVSK